MPIQYVPISGVDTYVGTELVPSGGLTTGSLDSNLETAVGTTVNRIVDSVLNNTTPFTYDYETGSNNTTSPEGSVVYNPPSLTAGTQDTVQNVSMAGVNMGDYMVVSFSNDLAGCSLRAWVKQGQVQTPGSTTNGIVSFVFANPTSGTVDLASGTVHLKKFDMVSGSDLFLDITGDAQDSGGLGLDVQ